MEARFTEEPQAMRKKSVEQGTHTALLKLRGYYFELYTRQYEDEATAKILT